MGQFGELADFFDVPERDYTGSIPLYARRETCERVLKAILMPELGSPRAYYSITAQIVPKSAQYAWELYQTLRCVNAWHNAGNPAQRDWSTMLGVQYDAPMAISGKVLPVVSEFTRTSDDV